MRHGPRRSRLTIPLLATLLVVTGVSGQSGGPTGTIVVANMGDNTATIIDAGTGKVFATLPTGEGPHEVAISHDGKWALVSIYGGRGKPGNSVMVIDIAKAAIDRTIILDDYQRPHGMVFLPGDTTAVVTCEGKGMLLMLNVRKGIVVNSLSTGGQLSHMVSSTTKGDLLVSGNIRSGTLAIVDASGRDSTKTVKVGRQPEGVAIAPDGRSAWAGSNVDSIVVVVDPVRAVAIDTLRGFGFPYRMMFSPDGRYTVVTDPAKAEVKIFDAKTRAQKSLITISADSLLATAEIKGSPSPEGLAISADSKWAFVALQGRNRLAMIDLARGVIVRYAVTGGGPDGVGHSPMIRE